MNTQTIFMCVVALLIGMLVANMLQNVCGCKKVEGFSAQLGDRTDPSVNPDMGIIDQFIENNQGDENDACGMWHQYRQAVPVESAVTALSTYCDQSTTYKSQEEWIKGLQRIVNPGDDQADAFKKGTCTIRDDVDFDSSCISSGLSN